RPPGSTPFPYTTLFRSGQLRQGVSVALAAGHFLAAPEGAAGLLRPPQRLQHHAQLQIRGEIVRRSGEQGGELLGRGLRIAAPLRSEEHTSELQSRSEPV